LRESKTFFNYTLDVTNQKVMSYCFLLKREVLEGYSFLDAKGDVADDLYKRITCSGGKMVLLGRLGLEARVWHPSNVTSLASGLINDVTIRNKLEKRLSQFTMKVNK